MQIQFTEEQIDALRAEAAQLDVSISELVRQAVEARQKARIGASPEDRWERARSIPGSFASGRSDVGRRHDDYLVEAFSD